MEVDGIVSAFQSVPALYIADGHHRSEAAAEVARRARAENPDHRGTEPVEFFLNVLFPDEELRILPYNRVVGGIDVSSADIMLAQARDRFDITDASGAIEPERHQFGLYVGGRWYRLTAKPDSFDRKHPTRSIDAAILSDNFLGPILGITDLRTDARIDFVGGIRGTEELVRLVDGGEAGLAFCLHPTSVDQLLAVADAGEVMPPKSTWFEPKLRSGMVVNLLKD